MIKDKYTLQNILLLKIILIIILLTGCSNTRIIVEGTKKILTAEKKTESQVAQTNSEYNNDKTLGHYKIGYPYVINNIKYTPKLVSSYEEEGIASWYGPKFHNKVTANGEKFDQNIISAAHKTLPLPSIVKVTNLNNQKELFIRINDRGPFVNDRIIDLSKEAAIKLNIYRKGTENVRVEFIDTGPHLLLKKFLNQNYLEQYAKKIQINITQRKTSSKFYLQLGYFKKEINAKTFLRKIKSKINFDLENNWSIFSDSSIINSYKVLLGPYEEKRKAKKMAAKLLELGYKTMIISSGNDNL